MLNNFLTFLQDNLYFIFIIALLLLILLLQTISYRNRLRNIRKDTLKRSKAVRGGNMMENFAPYFENFPCNPEDAKFLGKPVDFVCFSGLSEKDEADEIIFVEVKTGDSKLSQREKSIKNAVKAGRVRYVEYKIDSRD